MSIEMSSPVFSLARSVDPARQFRNSGLRIRHLFLAFTDLCVEIGHLLLRC